VGTEDGVHIARADMIAVYTYLPDFFVLCAIACTDACSPIANRMALTSSANGGDVGFLVGFAVGSVVGALVGSVVGLSIGSVVGLSVGSVVGLSVGSVVGLSVGAAVGPDSVGTLFAIGAAVGPDSKVGTLFAVGAAVGIAVGQGLTVGIPVGTIPMLAHAVAAFQFRMGVAATAPARKY
jgi:hypothetical protein